MECNSNYLRRIPNVAKSRIHAEETHYSDHVQTCNTTIPSILKNLKKLWLHSSLHSCLFKFNYNGKEESINNIFSTYVEPLLNYIIHTAFLQEWKLNLDVEKYDNQINANLYKPLAKK